MTDFELNIKNFQSIKKGSLVFPVGVSTIVGATNSGKTALIRAITSVLTNPPEAKSFITHGEDRTEVSIHYNGHNVTWSRTNKDSYYDVDGELHQKTGKTDLFEFINTGFYRTDDGEIVNIQDEWSSLFPFGRTDSQMYKLFEDVFCINDSTLVLSKIKSDESESKKDIVNTTQDFNRTSRKIEKLSEFLSDLDIDSLRGYRDEYSTICEEMRNLSTGADTVQKDIRIISSISGLKVDSIGTNCFDELGELNNAYTYIESNLCLLSLTKVEPIDFDVFREVEELDEFVNKLNKVFRVLDIDTDMPILDDTVFDELTSIEDSYDRVVELLKDVKDINIELEGIDSELNKVKTELNNMKTCPLCGSSVNEG